MVKGQLDAVLQCIRGSFRTRAVAPLTDGQLLDRFIRERSEDAFAVLVERHAAMVLTLACGVLHDPHEAEDVFQATFLVLAKKVRSIRRRRALGGWLHQVTYRLALKAKANNARRQTHQRLAKIVPEPAPEANLNRLELRAVLDEELSRLPEKYCTPLILHYLQGKSKYQTAVELGWSTGTVSGRLARARELLRSRLVRRGLTLSSAGVVVILAQSTVAVAVSPSLLNNTVKAALAFSGGIGAGAAVSASAVKLADGMVKRIALAKIKMMAAVVLGASVLGVGAVTHGALVGQVNDRPATKRRYDRILRKRNRGLLVSNRPHKRRRGGFVRIWPHPAGCLTTRGNRFHRPRSICVSWPSCETGSNATGRVTPTFWPRRQPSADGRFAFKDIAAQPMKISPSNIYRFPWSVVVISKGRGVVWHNFKSRNEQDLTLVMRPGAAPPRSIDGQRAEVGGGRARADQHD